MAEDYRIEKSGGGAGKDGINSYVVATPANPSPTSTETSITSITTPIRTLQIHSEQRDITSQKPPSWSESSWKHIKTSHESLHKSALDVFAQGMLTGKLLTEGAHGGARELSTARRLSVDESSVFCGTLKEFVRELPEEQWSVIERIVGLLSVEAGSEEEPLKAYAIYLLAEEARRRLLENRGWSSQESIPSLISLKSSNPPESVLESEESSSSLNAVASEGKGEEAGRNGIKRPKKLIPPFNFCHVEDGLYRSAAPAAMSFPFVRQLKLKSIVWVDHHAPSSSLLSFASAHKITITRLPLPRRPDPWNPTNLATITSALEILINRNNLPALICCEEGYHLTGVVVGCLRRLQGWNLSSILEEYRRFSTEKPEMADEVCIEFFEAEGVKIQRDEIPGWLWLT